MTTTRRKPRTDHEVESFVKALIPAWLWIRHRVISVIPTAVQQDESSEDENAEDANTPGDYPDNMSKDEAGTGEDPPLARHPAPVSPAAASVSGKIHRHLKVKEKSPLGRFVRFNRKLGSGSYKTVWLGFDNDTGTGNVLQPLQLLPAAKHGQEWRSPGTSSRSRTWTSSSFVKLAEACS